MTLMSPIDADKSFLSASIREIGVICDNYKTTKVDYTVILSHIGIEEDKKLAALLDKNLRVDLIIGGHSHTLRPPQFQHRLDILSKKWCFDSQFLRQVSFDDLLDLEEDFLELVSMLPLIFQMQHTYLQYINFILVYFNDRKAQDVGAGIDTKYP